MMRHVSYSLLAVLYVGIANANEYPLHTAIRSDKQEQFDLLLQDKAIDINKQLSGMPPLLLAVRLKKEYYIERLIADKRIDLTIENRAGRNALEESIATLFKECSDDWQPYQLKRNDIQRVDVLIKSIRLTSEAKILGACSRAG